MKKLALLPVLTLLAGCTVGPNYKRPTVNVPTDYRGVMPAQPATAASLGNEKWWDVYQDPVLTQLIHTALQQNYDVRIAATRVLQAQAQLGIVRANQFPSASVGAGIFSQQNAKVSNLFPAYEVNAGQLNLSVIWNLDFWGKYRRQTEAARAQMLASEWGQQAVISSLVANVATAYFQLRALDAELEIAKRTLGSRQQSLQLTQVLETHGSASDLDVSQSEQLVYTASESIPDLERQVQQQENLLSILLGENPGSIPRGRALTEQPVPDSVPAGLPSELLERRPDVLEAEANMMAANAQIGVAKAAYYPLLNLAAAGGFESGSITTLISGPSILWSAGPSAALTLFDVGRRRAASDQAIAAYNQQVANYRQTVLTGFQQVEDNIAGLRILEHEGQVQSAAVIAAQKYLELAITRYKGGVTSYLEVTTAQTAALSDELTAVTILGRRMVDAVTLVQALGGGWDSSALPPRPECCGKLTGNSK